MPTKQSIMHAKNFENVIQDNNNSLETRQAHLASAFSNVAVSLKKGLLDDAGVFMNVVHRNYGIDNIKLEIDSESLLALANLDRLFAKNNNFEGKNNNKESLSDLKLIAAVCQLATELPKSQEQLAKHFTEAATLMCNRVPEPHYPASAYDYVI